MYSQNKEEQVILNYFGSFKGTLLDAGANDGVTFSNSRQLLLNGWGGHLFEPSSVFGSLIALYGGNDKVKIYNTGIGAETNFKTLHESGSHVINGNDKGLVSTFIPSELTRWEGVEFTQKNIIISSFLDWYVYNNKPALDFITIDIEGMDWELLQAIDLAAVGCKCLCIEWNSRRDLERLFTQYCAKHNMVEIHRNSENLIFAV